MTKDMTFSASTGIHQGDRESQQDRVCLYKSSREANCILAIVSDGMGGLSYVHGRSIVQTVQLQN